MKDILEQLEERRAVARAGGGARRVEAYPKRTAGNAGELWNGPEALFRAYGFTTAKDDPVRPVLAKYL